MKYLSKISLVVTAGLAAVLPVLVAFHLVTAAGSGAANLYLAPGSTTVAQGDSFDIDIHEDSGTDTINAVQANLSYSSNLTYVNTTNSSDFGIAAQTTGGSGSVKIGRGTLAAVTGDHIVATVRFTANAGGTATVNFGAGSAVVRSNDNGAETLTLGNGSYSITSAATMTLSPASKTVSQGTSFDVAIYEDSGGDTVNAVQANLSYPTDKLTFVSATGNAADWPIQAQNTGGGGLVKIGRGTTTPVTGSHLVATVKFTASGAGTATVSFTSGSGIIRSTDNTAEPSTNSPGVYTVTATPTGGGSGGGSGGGTTGSGTKTGTSGTTKKTSTSAPKTFTSSPEAKSSPVTTTIDTTGPVISDIKVSNLSTKSATVSWKTSEPATSEVDFGLDTKYIISSSDASLATVHSLALNPKTLVGHKTYHFIVKSSDAAGNQSVSPDGTFNTGGFQVTTLEIAIAAAAAILAGGAWLMAAAGGLKLFGGGMMAASHGGIYVEPKPIILNGGAPHPAAPVIHPQSVAPAAQTEVKAPPQPEPKAPAKPAAAPSEPQTPGKVVGPKTAPAAPAENQKLPKWVKK